MVFTRLFCGITEHTLSYTCAHTPWLGVGGSSSVLYFTIWFVCPALPAQTFKRVGVRNTDLVWSALRRKTFVTAHWLKNECLCIIYLWLCNTGGCCWNPWPPKSRWCAVTDCRPPLWGLCELEGVTASQEFRNIWVIFPAVWETLS